MTTTLPRILGQNKPDALVNTTLFTVSLDHQVQFSLFVCNQDDDMDRFTIALIPSGETEDTARYIASETPLLGHGVFAASGLYLNGGDTVKIQSLYGHVSFTATGIELLP